MAKKIRTKQGFTKAIIDLLFMKEPSEAEFLLNVLCKTDDVMDNSDYVRHELMKQSLFYLRNAYSLAVMVADATHCDELPR